MLYLAQAMPHSEQGLSVTTRGMAGNLLLALSAAHGFTPRIDF